jgi:hypothetical protein
MAKVKPHVAERIKLLAATTKRVLLRPVATGIVVHAGTAVAATHRPLDTDDWVETTATRCSVA